MKDLLGWYGSSEKAEVSPLPVECGCMPHPYVAGCGLRVEQDGPTVHCLWHTHAMKRGPHTAWSIRIACNTLNLMGY